VKGGRGGFGGGVLLWGGGGGGGGEGLTVHFESAVHRTCHLRVTHNPSTASH